MALFSRKPAPDARITALEAEYQNYRRRTAAEREALTAAAARQTALAFLPVYDDLERALRAPSKDEAAYRGLELIFQNYCAVLAQLNITPMDSKGKIFNPTFHEAISHVTDPACRAEEIVQVIQTGFLMDEEVLRHAKVVVANCD